MASSRPITEPLREALVERSAAQTIRSIADSCGIDYRKLLAFSQGQPPAFDVLDVDRLAECLGLRLVPGAPPQDPQKSGARGKAR
jgi:hypothetical protein